MTKQNTKIDDFKFYFELLSKKENGKKITAKDGARLYSMRKKWYFESMADSIIPDDTPKGELFTDFIENGYYQRHEDLIQFMETEEVYEFAKKHFPADEEGCLDIYVRRTKTGFEIYKKDFHPLMILPRYWGLPHKNAKSKKILPIRCFYYDDFTLFRGSYLN